MFADLKKLVSEPHGLLRTETHFDAVLYLQASVRGFAEGEDDATVLPFADTRLNSAPTGKVRPCLTDSLAVDAAHTDSDTQAAPLLMLRHALSGRYVHAEGRWRFRWQTQQKHHSP